MANEKQRRAFISYSRINKEFTTKLVKGLRTGGYSVWFDLLDIPTGSRWDDEVEKALRECSIFMVILTPASIASENVKDEIGYAIDHGKRILPVLLEDCDVPLRLRRFQYVDFTEKSFEEGFESAKELLGDLIEQASVPVVAKAPVVEAPTESKLEPVKANPAPAMPVQNRIETVSTKTVQKKPISKGLVIGIIVVVALVIAGIGFSALSNNNPPVSNPVTQAPVVLQGKTIIGQWERRFPSQTDYLNFQDDGNYTIEARSNSTNEVITSDKGIFTYDNNSIYYGPDNKTESYYLDNGGDLLVMDKAVEQAWTRIK